MATKKKVVPISDTGDLLQPVDNSGPAPARRLHVNGKPIPDAFAHAIPFEMTDEGIRERKANRKYEPSGVKLVADEWDRNIERRNDLAQVDDTSREVWESTDPALEAWKKYGTPGMVPHLLSPAVCAKRGLRGWEPVIAPNGDPVKIGNMPLGQMPEAKKELRNATYRQQHADAQNQNDVMIQETQEKLIRTSGSESVARALRSGERVGGSSDPQAGIPIGVSHSRGNQAA